MVTTYYMYIHKPSKWLGTGTENEENPVISRYKTFKRVIKHPGILCYSPKSRVIPLSLLCGFLSKDAVEAVVLIAFAR